MKWFDKWFAKKCKQAWENKSRFDRDELVGAKQMAIGMGTPMVERSRPEGEQRINFELSSAVGGKILNVRHYDERRDRHENQTYVIPNGEDVGERVAKILNLELYKQ
jgi:hypothetical protein